VEAAVAAEFRTCRGKRRELESRFQGSKSYELTTPRPIVVGGLS